MNRRDTKMARCKCVLFFDVGKRDVEMHAKMMRK